MRSQLRGSSGGRIGVGFVTFLLMTVSLPARAYVRPGGWTRQVDLTWKGTQPESHVPTVGCTAQESISANGRYISFVSRSPDLVPGDTNAQFGEGCDVFVRDVRTGKIERASVNSLGQQAIGPPSAQVPGLKYQLSGGGFLSASGRYIVFRSQAINLVPNDTNLAEDWFIRDLRKGVTERISVGQGGRQTVPPKPLWTNPAGHASVSADGEIVAFPGSPYTQLDPRVKPGDCSLACIYVRNREKDETKVIVGPKGSEVEGVPLKAYAPNLSSNGRFVAFYTDRLFKPKEAVVPPFTVVRYDARTEEIESVPKVLEDGSNIVTPMDALSFSSTLEFSASSISANGRFIAFKSGRSDLVPNDSNRVGDLFVRDMRRSDVRRVNLTWYGGQTDRYAYEYSISPDGRYVAWESPGPGAVCTSPSCEGIPPSGRGYTPDPGEYDPQPAWLSYWADPKTSAVALIARDSRNNAADACDEAGGAEDNTYVLRPYLSSDARYVVFLACAVNLISPRPDPYEGAGNHLYVRHLNPPSATGIGHIGARGSVSVAEWPRFRQSGTLVVRDTPGGPTEFATPDGDLVRLQVTYRPEFEDLFIRVDVADMSEPALPGSPMGLPSPLYGLTFRVGPRSYEVRASSTRGGTFHLLDCTEGETCMKVRDLQGGFGTSGDRIDVALPVDLIGGGHRTSLSALVAYSSIGTIETGALTLADTIDARRRG